MIMQRIISLALLVAFMATVGEYPISALLLLGCSILSEMLAEMKLLNSKKEKECD